MAMRDVSAEGFRALLESEEPHACVDVRERGEYALEHIAGTTPLARGTLEYRAQTVVPGRRIPISLCCDDGRRSRLAGLTLGEMGYADVRVLTGGISAWRASGFATRAGWGVPGKEYGERVATAERPPEILAQELSRRLKAGGKIAVIDVRSREEFTRAHVPGAYHVPGGELLVRLPELGLERDTEIVVTCAGRTRGILGAQMLREAGLENVSVLTNGAMGWYLAGYDLEEGRGRAATGGTRSGTADWVERATRRLIEKKGVKFVSVAEFERQRVSDDILHYIVDVRLPEEFEAVRIPRSISIPAGQLALAYENFIGVGQAFIVVVADDVVRPVWAAALVQQLGFARVAVLQGGIAAWIQAGRLVERGEPKPQTHGLERAREKTGSITPIELRDLSSREGECLLLDVRGSGEFAFAHIPGARWLCRGKLELEWTEMAPPKNRPVVTVCDNGVRSALAALTLQSLGYLGARFLEGGMRAWQGAGLPVEDGLAGAKVTIEEAQGDFGHTLFKGALAKSRPQMERYLSWEEALISR